MLFFLRHGKTKWNIERRLQGKEGDSELLPVNPKFIEEIRSLFEEIKLDKMYLSPAKRVQTYVKLLNLNANEVISRDDLNEIGFGIFSGKKYEEIDKNMTELQKYDRWNFRPPEGESYNDVFKRVSPIAEFLTKNSNLNIAVAGHETTNKILIGKILNYSKDQILKFRQPNDVIYKIDKGILYKRIILGEHLWEKL